MKYEVVPAMVYEHVTGKRASIYGALPWMTDVERAHWKTVQVGYTLFNPLTGQVGVGRAPCVTWEEANALAERLGNCPSIGIGD
jgi:hypothetical protein